MAIEVRDVRQAFDEALCIAIATATIDGNDNRIAELVVIRRVAKKLTNNAIDLAIVELFREVEAQYRAEL